MSSEEDEFFDAPDAFACSPYARRWSDNEDDFIPTSLDFDNKNAQRRHRVESLKRSLVDHISPPLFPDPAKDFSGSDLRRVSLTDPRAFGLRTPTGIARKHRSTPYTQPPECFLVSAIPTIVAQDAVDRSVPPSASFAQNNDAAVTYGALEGLLGLPSSPGASKLSSRITFANHIEDENSPLPTPLDQLPPLPAKTDLTFFPNTGLRVPFSRQYSLPATSVGRSQVISSAPEVSYSQITPDSNALIEYVKSWSLDAAKRQVEVSSPSQKLPTAQNSNGSRIPQFLGSLVPDTENTDPIPGFSQVALGDQLVSGVLSNPQTQSGCPNEYGLHRPCRLVSTMVQTTSEDLDPPVHESAQESTGAHVTTLTASGLQLDHKSTRLKSATLHDEKRLNPIELHFRSLTTSNTSLPDATNSPGDTIQPQAANASVGKVSRFHKYFRDAVSAVKSATRAKIFNQDEESSDEDEEVIGNQGIRIRSSRQAKGRREFLQVKLVQEMKNEHTGAIWAMRFSPCGRLLATAGYDRNIRIWVLRQWYSFFKRMQQRSVNSTSNPEFESTAFIGSTGFDNVMDDENLLDSISLASTSASTAGKTDDGTSTCSSNPAFARRDESSPTGGGRTHLSSPGSHKVPDLERGRRTVFRSQPLLVYRGHEGVVTELAWSKNLFLLATSMDHQVRLWHISRRECLCLFSHNDTVPTIVFHPKDDRFFLSGSLDGKLRLWNIPDKKVRFWVEVPIPSALPMPANASTGPFAVSSLFKSTPPSTPQISSTTGHSRSVGPKTIITSAIFACDGTKVVVGTYDGRVMFFNSELTYITFIAIKSGTTKGRQCRVTAIELDPTDSNKILVTSNDSRLRLIDARDYHTLCKYRGFVNETSQIRASFSPTGRYLISGSENAFFYIWQKSLEVDRISRFSRARKDRNHCWEAIKAHDTMVTVAIFCPNPNLVLDKHLRHGWFPDNLSCAGYMDAARGPRLDELPSNADPRHQNPYMGELIVSADCNGCIRVFKKLSTSDSQASIGGSSRTQ